MKNLWRISILFMLPGMVLGGNTIAAFFRLTDGKLEPLTALISAGVLWTSAAYITCLILLLAGIRSKGYYPATAIAGIIFTLAVGGAVILFGNGTVSAFTGITASALATACTALGFAAARYTLLDRSFFIAGVVGGGIIWGYGALYSRLAWMETLFYYLALFLLVSWAFASPLTRWGSLRKRLIWLLVSAAGAVGGFYTVIVFSPPPTETVLAENPGKLWSKTYTGVNGRRFMLMEKSGKYAFHTPDGLLQMPDTADENLEGALLTLICVQNKEDAKIELIAPATSVLPKKIRALIPVKVDHYRVPESLNVRRFNWKKPDFSLLYNQWPHLAEDQASKDILFITALPENQYAGFLKNFLKHFTGALSNSGVVAILPHLLKNPAVFSFMHDHFPHSGVLPLPGAMWVFSRKPLDLSIKTLGKKMQELFNDAPTDTAEMFEILFSAPQYWQQLSPPQELTAISPESFRLLGSWWWIIIGAAAALLWRTIRLIGERRNIMYSWFNAVENGFSGMGTILLILALLLVNSGMYALTLSLISLLFIFVLCRWKAFGVWAALLGSLIVLWSAFTQTPGCIVLTVVLLQTIMLTGSIPFIFHKSVKDQQLLLGAVFLGMMLAAWVMLSVHLFNIPLLLFWSLIFAARVPGIWQYSKNSVYYSKQI